VNSTVIPFRPRGGGAAAPAAVRPDAPPLPTSARAALVFVMLSVTLFSTVGLRIVGTFPIEISLVALYGVVVLGLWHGWARVDPVALMLYAVLQAVATFSLLVNYNFGDTPVSFGSMAQLVAIYLPFAVVLHTSGDPQAAWGWAVRVFGQVALFCAFAGIAQFYAQFFIQEPWLFKFNQVLPWRLQGAPGYNTVIPVGDLFKSNGFFLREPSHFSFLMALAILLELQTTRRLWRLATFGLALLLTYSGTGLLVLAIGLLFPLGRRTVLTLLVGGSVGLVLIFALGEALNLEFTLNRVTEFGSERSSAYSRYIAPVLRLHAEFDSQPWSAFIGHGPGTILRNARSFSFDPTWAKALYEYGLLGLIALIALVGYCLTRITASSSLRVALFVGWLITGGYLLSPENCALLYLLLCGWPASERSSEAPTPART
jgi:hypothetical protein